MAAGDATQSTDEQILWMVRAGMVDAEIAARLNIPTGDVKQRIERLAKRHGVDGREGLRASSLLLPDKSAQRSRSDTFLRRFGSYAVVGVVCAVLGAAVATAFDSSAPEAPPAAATTGPTAAEPAATTEPVSIDGREWMAVGQFFFAGNAGFAPVAEVSLREEFAVVTLAREGFVRPVRSSDWNITTSYGGGFAGSAGGVPVVISIFPTESSRTVILPDAIAVATTNLAESPKVIVEVNERLSGRSHPVLVQADGSIFVDSHPSRDDVPIDYNTGEALDLSSAKLIGNLGPAARGAATNWCIDEPACRTAVASAGVVELLAPSGGSITCPDAAFSPVKVLTFESGAFRVHFRRVEMAVNGVVAGDLRCLVEGAVRNGVPMLEAGPRYQIDATNLEGSPVSVAIDRNGNVWAGDIKPKFGCPCRSGS